MACSHAITMAYMYGILRVLHPADEVHVHNFVLRRERGGRILLTRKTFKSRISETQKKMQGYVFLLMFLLPRYLTFQIIRWTEEKTNNFKAWAAGLHNSERPLCNVAHPIWPIHLHWAPLYVRPPPSFFFLSIYIPGVTCEWLWIYECPFRHRMCIVQFWAIFHC